MSQVDKFQDLPIPKYYRIYLSLKEQIETGVYHPGEAITPERQLAEEHGVSRLTVVKAIDLLVQDGLIDRQQGSGNYVLQLEDVSKHRYHTVAFIAPDRLWPLPSYVIVGALRVAMQNNVIVQVSSTEYKRTKDEIFHDTLAGKLDGIIMLVTNKEKSTDIIQQLARDNYPLIMIDRYLPDIESDRVVFGDKKAGYALTKKLIASGCRRIVFLATWDEFEVTSVLDRFDGYRQALAEAGLPHDENLVWLDIYDFIIDTKTNYTKKLGQYIQTQKPDGVVAVNHETMMRFHSDLMSLQTEILRTTDTPEGIDIALYDIYLAGISDKPITFKYPYLCAVAYQDVHKMGEMAMQLMIERLEGRLDSTKKRHITIPMTLHDF